MPEIALPTESRQLEILEKITDVNKSGTEFIPLSNLGTVVLSSSWKDIVFIQGEGVIDSLYAITNGTIALDVDIYIDGILTQATTASTANAVCGVVNASMVSGFDTINPGSAASSTNSQAKINQPTSYPSPSGGAFSVVTRPIHFKTSVRLRGKTAASFSNGYVVLGGLKS